MKFLSEAEGFDRINKLGRDGEDFIFVISYDRSQILAEPLGDKNIIWKLDEWSSTHHLAVSKQERLKISPVSFDIYQKAFQNVQNEIKKGNTYLLNLTFPAKITNKIEPLNIYNRAYAKHKIYIPNNFLCFSPESFISIKDNEISTYPMKGTIDADIPNAKELILNNPKEKAEHTMIVDLLRNDLNIVGKNTRVDKFRYIEKIRAGDKELLQVSSKISSTLPPDWRENIGSILREITPAGSITGTPKKKTTEIISEFEIADRGFYTGIFGVCKKNELKSAVMIRFIDLKKMNYHSGGGITCDSDVYEEYKEMLNKIYIPI